MLTNLLIVNRSKFTRICDYRTVKQKVKDLERSQRMLLEAQLQKKKIISPNVKENSILCITGDIRNMYIVNLKSNLIVPNKDKCAEYNPAITFQGCILHKCTELKNICMRILLLAFFI